MPADQTPESFPQENETPLKPATEQALRFLGIAPSCESDPMSPVDLRTVPRDQWADYECAPLRLPPDVAAYVQGMDTAMTKTEQEGIEDRLVTFYGITEPWTVAWQAGAFRIQRA